MRQRVQAEAIQCEAIRRKKGPTFNLIAPRILTAASRTTGVTRGTSTRIRARKARRSNANGPQEVRYPRAFFLLEKSHWPVGSQGQAFQADRHPAYKVRASAKDRGGNRLRGAVRFHRCRLRLIGVRCGAFTLLARGPAVRCVSGRTASSFCEKLPRSYGRSIIHRGLPTASASFCIESMLTFFSARSR
jgi:hypothetical protein